jgi:hypothetical protein
MKKSKKQQHDDPVENRPPGVVAGLQGKQGYKVAGQKS